MGYWNKDLIRAQLTAIRASDEGAAATAKSAVEASQLECTHPEGDQSTNVVSTSTGNPSYPEGTTLVWCRRCSKVLSSS